MTVLEHEAPDRFRVRFAALARRLHKSEPRGAAPPSLQIDPYLLARAVAEVMAACTLRSARGRRLLWNQYRVILARADFSFVRALQGLLERELGQVLAAEAAASGAELVGELVISVVADEGNELPAGEGVVRVAFAPDGPSRQAQAGELTVRFDVAHAADLMRAVGAVETVIVQEDGAAPRLARLRWPQGDVTLAPGRAVIAGRPHPGEPAGFVALTGASARISKQHVWLALTPQGVRIARPPSANPVAVQGAALAPGQEVVVSLPVEVVLSRGELVLTLVAA